MPKINIPELREGHRLGLWILLILLTAIILLFPVRLNYEYHAIESIYAFGDKLPLFTILFYIWIAILLLLLFARGKSSEWQKLGLVCIFALGIFGLWIINAPYGGHPDEIWQMGHIKYLQEAGKIDLAHPVFNYFQFPAFHLVNTSLSQISGSGVFETRIWFMLFSGVTFAELAYLLFQKFLKDSRLASLGVLLLLLVCVKVYSAETAFWPGNLANIFLVALLLLLSWRQDRAMGAALPLITIILLVAFTMSYLPTPTCFIFILAAIYLLQKVSIKNVVSLTAVTLFFVIFMGWEMYYSARMFDSMFAGLAPAFIGGFTEVGGRLSAILGIGTAYVGETVPLWANLTRLFWITLIFGFGGILGIRNLIRARRLSSIETMETGGLWGAIIFGLVCFLTFVGGEQTGRIFMYAPFFAIPIVFRFLSGFSRRDEPLNFAGFHKSLAAPWGWFRRHVVTLLIILFLVLSLPTFLADNYRVSTHTIYPQENSAGEFLQSTYGAEELNLYSVGFVASVYTYYVPEAHFRTMPVPEVSAGKEGLWLELNQYAERFENSRDENAIFVISERFRHSYAPRIIIESTDPRWMEFVNRLSQNDLIYDNGHVQIYKRLAE